MNNLFKKLKTIPGGMKFFLLVLLFYVVLYILSPELAGRSLVNFFEMFKKIIPILFLVFVVMVVVGLIFTRERTLKYLGKDSGRMGWFYAVIGGILISGPPYILYPMLGDLKKRGMSNPILAVFLFNRNVKIPFLPALVYYFSLEYALILSAYIVIFSIFNGLLVGFLVKTHLSFPRKRESR